MQKFYAREIERHSMTLEEEMQHLVISIFRNFIHFIMAKLNRKTALTFV